MATYQGGFSARPYTLRVHVTEHSREVGNNRSRYNVSVDVRSNSGYGSFRYDPFTAIVTIAGGNTNLTRDSGLVFTSGGDYTGKVLTVGSFVTGWINHDSNGNLSFGVRVRSSGSYGVFGSADSGTHTYTATPIPKPPAAPTIGQGGSFVPTEVYVGQGGSFVRCEVRVGVGGAFVAAV